MNEYEKMISGHLYHAHDKHLSEQRAKARALIDEFNALDFKDVEKRSEITSKLLGKLGNNVKINKPFYCDYGFNIEIGDNFYANYDCIFLDVNKIIIGNNVMLGPRVCIYTAGHPIDKGVRSEWLEFGKPVTIGNDVWIGGNTVINPGITIGSDVVIGSGSIVTKDIPNHVICAGNPCRVIREITEQDRLTWLDKKKRCE